LKSATLRAFRPVHPGDSHVGLDDSHYDAASGGKMRRVMTIAALVLMSAVTAMPLGAAATTLRGEVVDVQCSLKDTKNKGADHADCALSCARRGGTMGLLTADGVYTITGDYTKENNKKLIEFVARQVEATGEVTEKDGKKLIELSTLAAAQ
jgi:hypothetical protein